MLTQSETHKLNLQIKSRFQTIAKAIQILFSIEIEISGPLLLEIYFSL
jgi:hypothetical protein